MTFKTLNPQNAVLLTTTLAAILLAAGLLTADSDAGEAGDWPQWMGPRRDGVNDATAIEPWGEGGPRIAWRVKVGEGYSVPSVVGERLYVMGNEDGQDIVRCLKVADGSEVWRFSYACSGGGAGWPGTRISPTVDGERLYVMSLKGQIFCLRTADGEKLWSVDAPRELRARGGRHGFACQPLIDGEKLFIELGTPAGDMVAFNKITGEVLWQSGQFTCGHASPILATLDGVETLVIQTADGLAGFAPADGKVLWHHPQRVQWESNCTTPTIEGDSVFISSIYTRPQGVRLRVANNKLTTVWTTKDLANHCTSSVLYEGTLYGFAGRVEKRGGARGEVVCVDWASGQTQWQQEGFGVGGLMVADGKLVILGDRGELALAEATPGGYRELCRAKLWERGLNWNMPVVVDGRIYARSFQGELVCVDARKAE
jgi:outer membrane protein assembly factor BamB